MVDQYATLKLATTLYEAGKYQAAAEVARSFLKTELPMQDKKLEKERELVAELAPFL